MISTVGLLISVVRDVCIVPHFQNARPPSRPEPRPLSHAILKAKSWVVASSSESEGSYGKEALCREPGLQRHQRGPPAALYAARRGAERPGHRRPRHQRSKGFGFVEMGSDAEASKASPPSTARCTASGALTVNEAKPACAAHPAGTAAAMGTWPLGGIGVPGGAGPREPAGVQKRLAGAVRRPPRTRRFARSLCPRPQELTNRRRDPRQLFIARPTRPGPPMCLLQAVSWRNRIWYPRVRRRPASFVRKHRTTRARAATAARGRGSPVHGVRSLQSRLRDGVPGDSMSDWLEAERQLSARQAKAKL